MADRCSKCHGDLPANDPDACSVCAPTWTGRWSGPVYPAQVEREEQAPRLAALREAVERAELPQETDPEIRAALGGCGNPVCDVPWHRPRTAELADGGDVPRQPVAEAEKPAVDPPRASLWARLRGVLWTG